MKHFLFSHQPARRITAMWLSLLGLALIAGCAVGPNYKRPAINTPGTFRSDVDVSTNSFGDLPWWQVFHDETLQHLIRVALTNNYDLRIAVTHVEQERAVIIEARSQFFPQVDYEALAGQGKNVSGGSPSPPIHGVSVEHSRFYAGDVNASWEIDLWGR